LLQGVRWRGGKFNSKQKGERKNRDRFQEWCTKVTHVKLTFRVSKINIKGILGKQGEKGDKGERGQLGEGFYRN